MSVWHEPLSDGLVVVGVSGRLDQLLTPQLEETLLNLIGEGQNRLIVDMSGVTYINSGGLRALVTAWRQARQANGDVTLCSLSDRVQEIFNMVGFDKVFRIYATCDQAQSGLRQAG